MTSAFNLVSDPPTVFTSPTPVLTPAEATNPAAVSFAVLVDLALAPQAASPPTARVQDDSSNDTNDGLVIGGPAGETADSRDAGVRADAPSAPAALEPGPELDATDDESPADPSDLAVCCLPLAPPVQGETVPQPPVSPTASGRPAVNSHPGPSRPLVVPIRSAPDPNGLAKPAEAPLVTAPLPPDSSPASGPAPTLAPAPARGPATGQGITLPAVGDPATVVSAASSASNPPASVAPVAAPSPGSEVSLSARDLVAAPRASSTNPGPVDGVQPDPAPPASPASAQPSAAGFTPGATAPAPARWPAPRVLADAAAPVVESPSTVRPAAAPALGSVPSADVGARESAAPWVTPLAGSDVLPSATRTEPVGRLHRSDPLRVEAPPLPTAVRAAPAAGLDAIQPGPPTASAESASAVVPIRGASLTASISAEGIFRRNRELAPVHVNSARAVQWSDRAMGEGAGLRLEGGTEAGTAGTPVGEGMMPPADLVDLKQAIAHQSTAESTARSAEPQGRADGMSVAKSAPSMDKPGNQEQIAAPAEQEMPARTNVPMPSGDKSSGGLRGLRAAPVRLDRESELLARGVLFSPLFDSDPVPSGPFASDFPASRHPSEVALAGLERMVLREVTQARHGDVERMAMTLHPDAQTELFIEFRRGREGFEASVRCERGDFGGLNAGWNQLQDTLARHQINLLPLREAPPAQGSLSAGFGQPQGSAGDSASRQPPSRQMLEPPATAAPGSTSHPVREGAGRRPASGQRGWECWA